MSVFIMFAVFSLLNNNNWSLLRSPSTTRRQKNLKGKKYLTSGKEDRSYLKS